MQILNTFIKCVCILLASNITLAGSIPLQWGVAAAMANSPQFIAYTLSLHIWQLE